MNKYAIVSIAGLVLTLTAVWLGAYVLGQIPNDHWSGTPTFMTAYVSGCFGLWAFVYGLVKFNHEDT